MTKEIFAKCSLKRSLLVSPSYGAGAKAGAEGGDMGNGNYYHYPYPLPASSKDSVPPFFKNLLSREETLASRKKKDRHVTNRPTYSIVDDYYKNYFPTTERVTELLFSLPLVLARTMNQKLLAQHLCPEDRNGGIVEYMTLRMDYDHEGQPGSAVKFTWTSHLGRKNSVPCSALVVAAPSRRSNEQLPMVIFPY